MSTTVVNANIENTLGDLSIFLNRHHHKHRHNKYVIKCGESSVSTQFIDFKNQDDHEKSYAGEISGNFCVCKCYCLEESREVRMVVKFKLSDFNIEGVHVMKSHGLGHVVFRSNRDKLCTSVVMCLHSFCVTDDGCAMATYVGHVEKNVKFGKYKSEVDACVTFLVTYSVPNVSCSVPNVC